ncbi:hypothetical protein QYE88_42445, partial [Enterobacter hormaechei subsp. steigerwaltii]|nr:hypothetical protein [Enterobacter hormaechei subsp. steigerwaltii]
MKIGERVRNSVRGREAMAGCRGAALTTYKAKNPAPYGTGFFLIDAWQFPTLTWGDPTLPSALRRFTSE